MRGSTDYDFILSIALFAVVYVSIFTFLPYMTLSSSDQQDLLFHESDYLSSVLIKSPGYPKNWTDVNNVVKLGLSYYETTYYPNILDYDKVQNLTGVTCNSLRAKSDIDLNFSINVKADYNYNCTGSIPDYARRVDRPVQIYNGSSYEPAVFQLYVW